PDLAYGLSKPVNPQLRRAAGTHHARRLSFFLVEPIPALRIVPLRKSFRKETPCIFGPAPAGPFLVRASSGRPSCCASTTPQHFSCEDEEPRPNSAQGGKDTRL